MDLKSEKIIASVTTKKTIDATYSQNLELEGTKTVLNSLVAPCSSQSISADKQQLLLDTVVTDEHRGIIKMIKNDFPNVRHEGDVWHFVKRVKKWLSVLSEKKETSDLGLWIKSVSNFIWTICQICNGDENRLLELWRSILLHVSNRHSWEANSDFHLVKKCLHNDYLPEQTRKIAWLKYGSKSYQALESIINDKQLLWSIRRCSRFLQTSKVESFHSCILRFAPKRLSFGWQGYNSRIHLAILHFNENIGRKIATTAVGEMRTCTVVPLATGEWTMKVILEKQTFNWRQTILKQIFEERRKQADEGGHRIHARGLRLASSLVSTIPREDPETLLSNLRKHRHLD